MNQNREQITPDISPSSSDWEIVVAALSYRGSRRHQLSDRDAIRALRMADGFGSGLFSAPPSSWDEYTRNMFWDWSSVRDSSDAAIEEMADFLRRRLALPRPIGVGSRVVCEYRESPTGFHVGTVVAIDVRQSNRFRVEWDFGSTYWDTMISPVE